MFVIVVNGEPSEKILIIARNMLYVNEWCWENGINPRSRNVKFIRSIVDFQGIKDAYYVDLGTDSPEFRTLLEQLKILGHIKPLPVIVRSDREEDGPADASSSRGPEETP
jgi:hypothetical protein